MHCLFLSQLIKINNIDKLGINSRWDWFLSEWGAKNSELSTIYTLAPGKSKGKSPSPIRRTRRFWPGAILETRLAKKGHFEGWFSACQLIYPLPSSFSSLYLPGFFLPHSLDFPWAASGVFYSAVSFVDFLNCRAKRLPYKIFCQWRNHWVSLNRECKWKWNQSTNTH